MVVVTRNDGKKNRSIYIKKKSVYLSSHLKPRKFQLHKKMDDISFDNGSEGAVLKLETTSSELLGYIQKLNVLEFSRQQTDDPMKISEYCEEVKHIIHAVNENIQIRRSILEGIRRKSLNFIDIIGSQSKSSPSPNHHSISMRSKKTQSHKPRLKKKR